MKREIRFQISQVNIELCYDMKSSFIDPYYPSIIQFMRYKIYIHLYKI